jgi:hypothetical protein
MEIIMKRTMFSLMALCLLLGKAQAFCGFYVAKADATLFNETSQVILVRDGDHTTVTMSSDFKGDVKDFAMVIPVPVILKQEDVRVVDQSIFDHFDSYSAPRIVEYYDESPCYENRELMYDSAPAATSGAYNMAKDEDKKEMATGVTIEAKYTVGEYDILILSAKESDGLKTWLTDNGYKIPQKAEEVLEPYIKSKMKFFVVKVNLEEQAKKGYETLRPLQISFNSNKFMLPLRLGMANSKGSQDMIVYAFSKKGRVETVNYRTAKVPTDINIPLFVRDKFSQYYVDLFNRSYVQEGKNAVMLEFAWDLSGTSMVKCDPCTGTIPVYSDLVEAGITWLKQPYNQWSSYQGDVYITRLHVRYDREHFPQDLFFEETPNQEHFQARYILQYPAQVGTDCPKAKPYFKQVYNRRVKELNQLASATGWDISKYESYLDEYASKAGVNHVKKGTMVAPPVQPSNGDGNGNQPSDNGSNVTNAPITYQPIDDKAVDNNPYLYVWVALMGVLVVLSLAFKPKSTVSAAK